MTHRESDFRLPEQQEKYRNMPNADREGWLSISYRKWMETCVEDDTYAFVITVSDEEQLDKLETVFRRLYPDVRHVKQILLKENDAYTGYIIKCRFNDYVLTMKDIEIILHREIKDETFSITRVQDYRPEEDATVLAFPTGCTWRIQSSF